MNIKMDVEMTPEEMRRLIGLPDVQEFNQAVMKQMLEKMTSGAEGYDPLSFFQSSIGTNTDFAKKWMESLSMFGAKSGKS